MSKAFTREDDSGEEVQPVPVPLLPPGVKNYLTSEGRDRLQDELAQLRQQRPAVVESSLTDVEVRRELGQLDLRIQHLEQCLGTAEVVPPPAPPHDRVRFGSTVTVRDARGETETYRIVGADEADFARGEVSWRSPIAAALLHAELGAKVPFKFPSGATTLEIMAIH